MRKLSLLLLLLVPLAGYAQGIWENMVNDVAKARTDTAAVLEELKVIKAQLQLLLQDSAANKAAIKSLQDRVAALEKPVPAPDPTPTPEPAPVPQPGNPKFELIGGWRIKSEFARGSFCIDHRTNTLYMAGHAQRNEIQSFVLTSAGTSADINTWPIVTPKETKPGWWEGGYACGVAFLEGQVVVSPKKFYDTAPPSTLSWFYVGGKKIDIQLPRQRFAGLIKSADGTVQPGCGGYESGQGWARGPTWALLNPPSADGSPRTAQVLIDYPQTTKPLECCPREANYYPLNDAQKEWVCMGPVDGKGYWCCDRVYGGGIKLPDAVYYWPRMGTGSLDYKRQNTTFGEKDETYLYRFGLDGKLLGYELWGGGAIKGQDISPDGKHLYLMEENAWKGGLYQADPVLRVYAIK